MVSAELGADAADRDQQEEEDCLSISVAEAEELDGVFPHVGVHVHRDLGAGAQPRATVS